MANFHIPLVGSAGDMPMTELARRVVTTVAPGELELLPAVTQAWLDGDLPVPGERSGRWLGGSIGIGLDPQLTALLVYPLLVEVFSPFLESGLRSGVGWLRRRNRVPAVPPVVPALDPSEVEQVRNACYKRSLALGLAETKARLLADAVSGALVNPTASASEEASHD